MYIVCMCEQKTPRTGRSTARDYDRDDDVLQSARTHRDRRSDNYGDPLNDDDDDDDDGDSANPCTRCSHAIERCMAACFYKWGRFVARCWYVVVSNNDAWRVCSLDLFSLVTHAAATDTRDVVVGGCVRRRSAQLYARVAHQQAVDPARHVGARARGVCRSEF